MPAMSLRKWLIVFFNGFLEKLVCQVMMNLARLNRGHARL